MLFNAALTVTGVGAIVRSVSGSVTKIFSNIVDTVSDGVGAIAGAGSISGALDLVARKTIKIGGIMLSNVATIPARGVTKGGEIVKAVKNLSQTAFVAGLKSLGNSKRNIDYVKYWLC